MTLSKAEENLCSVRGCRREIDASREMCNQHYCAWWRQVRRDDPDRLPRCDVCGGAHHGRGWCKTHYDNWQARGDPRLGRPPRVVRLCSIEGCEKTHSALGLCGMHARRLRVHGDPLWEQSMGRPPVRLDVPDDLRKKATRIHYRRWGKGEAITEEEHLIHTTYWRLVRQGRRAA